MMGRIVDCQNNKYEEYFCECGKDTEYGIFRFKGELDWCIGSCCGGGCVSAEDIKYCPFCGKIIEVKL
jgi:hypothetical protein